MNTRGRLLVELAVKNKNNNIENKIEADTNVVDVSEKYVHFTEKLEVDKEIVEINKHIEDDDSRDLKADEEESDGFKKTNSWLNKYFKSSSIPKIKIIDVTIIPPANEDRDEKILDNNIDSVACDRYLEVINSEVDKENLDNKKTEEVDNRDLQVNDLVMDTLKKSDICLATYFKSSVTEYVPELNQKPHLENICKCSSNCTCSQIASSNDTDSNLSVVIPYTKPITIYDFQETPDSESEVDDSVKDKTFSVENCDNLYASSSSDTSSDLLSEDLELQNNIAEYDNKYKIKNSTKLSGSEQLKNKKGTNKKVAMCKFCEEDVISTNLLRHIKRCHGEEKEVREILSMPKKSKERRNKMSLLRHETNFNLYLNGITRPNREISNSECETPYYPCSSCKGLFLKSYLKRHAKSCINKSSVENRNCISKSHTLTACSIDKTNVISKLSVKEQVFDLMKGDDIAFQAKKDLLIAHFGESYLKKHKRERVAYACSNRMRELSRLLIRYREIVQNKNVPMKDLLLPRNFDNVIFATRQIVGYNPEKKTFTAPSLAMHLGTSLKNLCDELMHLILKETRGFQCNPELKKTWLEDVKNFKKLVEARWNIELGSLANKDLQEKRWNKPLIVPLVSDVKKFRDETVKIVDECISEFCHKKDNENTYKMLVQCTLALLILFNRRRIGDVQYLKIANYKINDTSSFKDFENVLTHTEKLLTKKYKRVVNSGKGSRAVVILIPEMLQRNIEIILQHREKYIKSVDNDYVFATPGSTIKWGKGDVAFRLLTKRIKLENPQSITSNKLRKQIATVTQILSLTQEETKQFSKFMGHTQKTHEEFYELPIDLYQTAKVSKLLLMMEKGTIPVEHKGKSLGEISLDINLECAEENEDSEDEGITAVELQPHTESVQIYGTEHENISPNINYDYSEVVEKEASNTKTAKKEIDSRKRGWNQRDINYLEEEFSQYLKRRKYPSGTAIKDFIEKRKIDKTVMCVKSKLQHLMKIKY